LKNSKSYGRCQRYLVGKVKRLTLISTIRFNKIAFHGCLTLTYVCNHPLLAFASSTLQMIKYWNDKEIKILNVEKYINLMINLSINEDAK
jgi:protein associated with RNAse G/E